MKIINTKLNDVFIFEDHIFKDERGLFIESFNQASFEKLINKKIIFVQDNFSESNINVIRGLHYQAYPQAQGKLIRVINGEILDIVLDLRKSSSTFGKWISEIISSDKRNQIWIPPGFAHGFLTKTNNCQVQYKTTEYYYPNLEQTIIWNDSSLNINWGIDKPKLSTKDLNGKHFSESIYFT